MRQCLKEPIPQIMRAYHALSDAVEAHMLGERELAAQRFRDANCPDVWEWLNASWVNVSQHVVEWNPAEDTKLIPSEGRDPDRNIVLAVKRAVLARDGYRCRYCGLPVIHADIRKIAHDLYPDEVPWISTSISEQHAGFQVFWLQFDHVVPHSHGGRSTPDNVVVSCALCNFGKDRFTLKQLGLEDPRLRAAVASSFDGLEGFRRAKPKTTPIRAEKPKSAGLPHTAEPGSVRPTIPENAKNERVAFFFPGGWIGGRYVNIPPIGGKSRWFKLGAAVNAEHAVRDGISGCVVFCPPSVIERRGLDVETLRDRGEGA